MNINLSKNPRTKPFSFWKRPLKKQIVNPMDPGKKH